MATVSQQDYYLKPGESFTAYNTRIAGLRGDTAEELATTQKSTQDYVAKNPTSTSVARLGAPITSATLAPAPKITPVTATDVQPYPVQDLFNTPQLTATPQESLASDLSSRIQSLNDSLVGQSDYREKMLNKYNVPDLISTQNDLATQLQGIKNEAAAIPLQLQQGASDRGVTLPVLGRQENSRLRTNAIAALGVSTLLEASRGNLAAAQDLAERAVAQKYGPIKERIAAATANLQLILNDPKTSLQDKNRAQAQLDIQNKKAYDLGMAEENMKETYNIATTAASNGQNFTPTTQYPSLAVALSAIQKAPTKEEALNIATSVGLVSAPKGTTASDMEKLLSPTEAQKLGVPYGTTRGEAAGMGITPTSTTSTTSSSSSYKFTPTQLNTGAARAAMSLDAFKSLDGDVQNFYVNSKDLVAAFGEALTSVQSGEASADDVKANIDSMAIPESVKQHLRAQVDAIQSQQPDKETSNIISRAWNGISSFFGW